MPHNKQVNKGHSLFRTVCEWLRHSIANRAPQTAPITKSVMCFEASDYEKKRIE